MLEIQRSFGVFCSFCFQLIPTCHSEIFSLEVLLSFVFSLLLLLLFTLLFPIVVVVVEVVT